MARTLSFLLLAFLTGCSTASADRESEAVESAIASRAATLASCFARAGVAGDFDIVCRTAASESNPPFVAEKVSLGLISKTLVPGAETLIVSVAPDRFPLTVRATVQGRSGPSGTNGAFVTQDLSIARDGTEVPVTEPWGFISV